MTDSSSTKRCAKCGATHPATPEFFGVKRADKSGLASWCRACLRTESLRYKHEGPRHSKALDLLPEGFKRCSACQQVRPMAPGGFRRDSRSPDGWMTQCAECVSEKARQRTGGRPRVVLTASQEGCKTCSQCFRELPATTMYFNIAKRGQLGLSASCKGCIARKRKAQHIPKPVQPKHPVVNGMKRCIRCGIEKPADLKHFAKAPRGSTPFTSDCRQCQSLRTTAWAKANPEKSLAQFHKRRARLLGAGGSYSPSDIKLQFAIQRGLCFWCKEPLETSGKNKFNVDHVIPISRGGSNDPSNLVCACDRCNSSKGNKLPHEWAKRPA